MKTTPSHLATARSVPSYSRIQLACLAASPATVRAAIDAGADWVRIPYVPGQPCPPGLTNDRLRRAMRYAHGRERKLALDLHIASSHLSWLDFRDAIPWAVEQGFDAIVISDFALGLYCGARFPDLPVHLVAPPGICARMARVLRVQMNLARLLVPSALSMADLVEIATRTDVELEVLCDTHVVNATAPTNGPSTSECTSGDISCNDPCYSPKHHLAVSLQQLPLMASLGIRAIQVQPRTDMPDEAATVTRVWRSAIDRCLEDSKHFAIDPAWTSQLGLRRWH